MLLMRIILPTVKPRVKQMTALQWLLSVILCGALSIYAGEGRRVSHCLHSLEDSLPYISPGGYNASLNGAAVQFTCIMSSNTDAVIWRINGNTSSDIGESVLAERRITYSDDTADPVINIEPRAENDNTTISCTAIVLDTIPVQVFESSEVVFRVQGEFIALSV